MIINFIVSPGGPVPDRYKQKLLEEHARLMEELQLKLLLPTLYSKGNRVFSELTFAENCALLVQEWLHYCLRYTASHYINYS